MPNLRLCPLLLLLVSLFSGIAFSQSEPWLGEDPKDDVLGVADRSLQLRPAPVRENSVAGVTIPAGTKVMMFLTSPMHSTSGTVGSGLYLETLYPVILENHVVIPAGTQVQGVVERNQRPGHVDRKAEFRFRFTTLVFPNNHVQPIAGGLVSLPGNRNVRTKDKEGTVGTVDEGEKVVTAAVTGGGAGAIIGSVRHFGIGTYVGAGLGAGAGVLSVLLKRGSDISLPVGAQVEMVLETPVTLDPDQVAFNSQFVRPSRPGAVTARAAQQENPRNQARHCRPSPLGLPVCY